MKRSSVAGWPPLQHDTQVGKRVEPNRFDFIWFSLDFLHSVLRLSLVDSVLLAVFVGRFAACMVKTSFSWDGYGGSLARLHAYFVSFSFFFGRTAFIRDTWFGLLHF